MMTIPYSLLGPLGSKEREERLKAMAKRKTVTARTGERLVRAAMELEDIASRLADEGFGDEEFHLRAAAADVHRIGHRVLDKIEGKTS